SDKVAKVSGDALKNCCPAVRSSSFSLMESGLFWCSRAAFNTASLAGASTHSMRRSSVKGKTMRPYWDCLKSPRSKSATDQIKEANCEYFSAFKIQPLTRHR